MAKTTSKKIPRISEDVEETELPHAACESVTVVGTAALETLWQLLLERNKPRPSDPEIPLC